MLFVVVDGCKMLQNSSFDSMSHFVQDKFQSTNSDDKFEHIQYMSNNTHTHTHTHTRGKENKNKSYPQHILQTHRKHIQNIKSKPKHIFKLYNIHFQFLICYADIFPFNHHKRNIFHFLIVAFPLGDPLAGVPGAKATGTLNEFQLRLHIDPTGDATARGLRPNMGSSGRGLRAKATGNLPGYKIDSTFPQRETLARGLRPNKGKLGRGLRAPKPRGATYRIPSYFTLPQWETLARGLRPNRGSRCVSRWVNVEFNA